MDMDMGIGIAACLVEVYESTPKPARRYGQAASHLETSLVA